MNDLYERTRSLQVGQVFTNFRKLCDAIGTPAYNGNQRIAQIKEFKRYFSYETEGRKITITEVYDEPLPKESRIANNSKYTRLVQDVLIKYLSEQPGEKVYLTQLRLWQILGLVNAKYANFYDNIEQLKKIDERLAYFHIKDFFNRASCKNSGIVKRSLESLQRRHLLLVDDVYIVVELADKDNKNSISINREATESERKYIMKTKRKLLEEMGFETEVQIRLSRRKKAYYNALSETFLDEQGWVSVYSAFKIIYNKGQLPKAENAKKSKLQLNKMIIEALDEQADKNYKKQGLTNQETLTLKLNAKKDFYYYEEYPKLQHLLSQELIKI